MTKYHDVDITCPYCGRTGPFRIYDSINTVLDPELKEALFDFSLFTFTCPVCQKKAPVLYPLLYHQMEDRLKQKKFFRSCPLQSGNMRREKNTPAAS